MNLPGSRRSSPTRDLQSREDLSPLGANPIVFVPADSDAEPFAAGDSAARLGIVVGVDASGELPQCRVDAFDVLLTTAPKPPRPWVAVQAAHLDEVSVALAQRVRSFPLAATTLAQVLRSGERLPFEDALVVESLAYSVLLAGPEFRRWREGRPMPQQRTESTECVKLERHGDVMTITLSRPQVHNALSAQMRDELVAALEAAILDGSVQQIILEGSGRSFCSGGDLQEFGTAPDPATAHAIRLQRSVALYVHRAGQRLTARIHGACIGGGIEIAAAAANVIARPDTQCRLPELDMGLIPGAGGTVTIPRRIGRHRACFMMLSGAPVDCDAARAWGLIDAIEGVE